MSDGRSVYRCDHPAYQQSTLCLECWDNMKAENAKLRLDFELWRKQASVDHAEAEKLRAEVERLTMQGKATDECFIKVVDERDSALLQVRELQERVAQLESDFTYENVKAIDANRQVDGLRKYIALLGEELNETAGMAGVHGWRSTRYEKGVEMRKQFGIGEFAETPVDAICWCASGGECPIHKRKDDKSTAWEDGIGDML